MPRYLTRSAYFDEAAGDMIVQPEPLINETDGLVDTGLLDAAGKPIFKTERIPISRPRYRVKAITRRI